MPAGIPVTVRFTELGLSEPLLRAVAETGYTTPTPIQAQGIPLVLKGGDLLAAAQTGTGKTAGFTLPILHRLTTNPLTPKPGRPRCLILVPTRELAAQVEESVRTYGKYVNLKSMVMFGGVNINPQYAALRGRVDILVATPGRLLDHVGQKTVDLSGVEILVLDEADRMLDMGFIRDIRKVIALIPKQRQTLLFSATFSDEIKLLANGLLNNPGCIEVARRNTPTELVEQSVHLVPQIHKKDLLSHLIRHHNWQQVLVFTRTKHGANKLAEKLLKDNIPAAAIHGNKSQAARTRALADFKSSKLQVLVATDIAARGIDIDQLPQVVNFELPNVPEDYVHRIGRTGRAGSVGAAVSLVDAEEMGYLRDIERLIKRAIVKVEVEDFVPPVRPAGAQVERDERPPRQGRPGGGGQNRGQGRGQPSGRPGKPAGSAPRSASGPAKPAGPKPAVANPRGPRPAPAAATGAPTPNRRESHNRPQAALFSAKPNKGER
jgi:ATP-dependent RNA helicase RhlE